MCSKTSRQVFSNETRGRVSAFCSASPFFPVLASTSRYPIESTRSQSLRTLGFIVSGYCFNWKAKLRALCTKTFLSFERCWIKEIWSFGMSLSLSMKASFPRFGSLLSKCGKTSSSSGRPKCVIRRWFNAVSITAWSMITCVQSFLHRDTSSKKPFGTRKLSVAHLSKAANCARISSETQLFRGSMLLTSRASSPRVPSSTPPRADQSPALRQTGFRASPGAVSRRGAALALRIRSWFTDSRIGGRAQR